MTGVAGGAVAVRADVLRGVLAGDDRVTVFGSTSGPVVAMWPCDSVSTTQPRRECDLERVSGNNDMSAKVVPSLLSKRSSLARGAWAPLKLMTRAGGRHPHRDLCAVAMINARMNSPLPDTDSPCQRTTIDAIGEDPPIVVNTTSAHAMPRPIQFSDKDPQPWRASHGARL